MKFRGGVPVFLLGFPVGKRVGRRAGNGVGGGVFWRFFCGGRVGLAFFSGFSKKFFIFATRCFSAGSGVFFGWISGGFEKK